MELKITKINDVPIIDDYKRGYLAGAERMRERIKKALETDPRGWCPECCDLVAHTPLEAPSER